MGSVKKRCVAIALVAIMVVSAFALIAPNVSKKVNGPVDQSPAKATAVGPAEVDYTMSNFGESYMKSTSNADLGRHTGPAGLNLWYLDQPLPPGKWRNYRNYYYGDIPVRNSYPYVIAYGPYSDFLSASTPNLFSIHSFYKLGIEAKNITGLGTGSGKDPLVLPILAGGPSPIDLDGGDLQFWLYLTYLTYNETDAITAGTHYANTYYGVPAGAVKWGGTDYYDGWWMETQGRWQFSRLAAAKFLGISGTDLRTSFNSSNAGNAIGLQWSASWGLEGSDGGDYNIYAAYDYPISDGSINVYLKLDPDWSKSTADSISVVMWSRSWGAEALFSRYMDASGVRHQLSPYMENWYLNGTLNSEYGNTQERMTTVYHMTSWKDAGYAGASWMIEGQHIDYTADKGPPSPDWVSLFDPYYQYYYDAGYEPTRMSYIPGQPTYGTRIHYWQTPMTMSLAAGDSLSVKLPSVNGWGVTPYTDASDVLDTTKVAQLNAHGMGGEWVLGHGWPTWYYSPTYYDGATKTLTFNGPLSFDRNANPIVGYTQIDETGSPQILLDISPVSHYKMQVLGTSPFSTGTTYVLQVTPQDLANANVLCTQTVQLPAVTGVTYGATSHTFLANESSWNTTIVFSAGGTINLKSQDQYFFLDIVDTYSVSVVAPGFTLNLYKGWNFVTVPGLGFGYTAKTLGLARFDTVASWNPATQSYDKTYIVGVSPDGSNFPIQPSTGYWINTGADEVLSLSGTFPTDPQSRTVTIPGTTGWINLALNSGKTTLKASNIPGMYSGGTVTSVAWYNSQTKTYKTYIPGVPPSDFTLIPGQAYWVSVNGGGTFTYTP